MYETYSDISIRGKFCGWAFYVLRNGEVFAHDAGVWRNRTCSNENELLAICEALKRIPSGEEVVAYSDIPQAEAFERHCQKWPEAVGEMSQQALRLKLRLQFTKRGGRSRHYRSCHRKARGVAVGGERYRRAIGLSPPPKLFCTSAQSR